MMLSIFSCASWPFVCLLRRNVCLDLLLIFWLGCLIVRCMSCCYILEINPLSITSFANTFSHSVGCLSILFMISFTVQSLSLIRSPFIFVFIFVYLFFCFILFLFYSRQLLLLSCFSRVQLCVTPEMAAHQAPLSLGFSRQEHWSGLPFPSPMHESEK